MLKSELISAISIDTSLKKKDVVKVIDSFVETVAKVLSREEKVTLVGFGSWSTRQRKERDVRNPRTGDMITVPSATVPKFTPSVALREALTLTEEELPADKRSRRVAHER